ncbi:integral membrane sensor signal transduction histidine kinase [Roseibium sp. TrichSKD4]|uniref:sensor histidine kinase n=1 Tax=Roseibium sp. TrichSKD4 TaxID=744980 RepID=UPI0001E562B2|nr:sensor histidine kinase [Roseibium sp. TrichSKD4]EFO33838.1 integral membrane sensor signal transduction histidine kinase [Roseibium sp. TrichSKD4]
MSAYVHIRGSIHRRLITLLLIGAAFLAVLLYFVVQSVARQIAQESHDNILIASATSILDNASVVDGEIMIDVPYSAFSMLGNASDERVYYAIRLGREFLSGYGDLPVAGLEEGSAQVFQSTQFRGEDIRLATLQRPIFLGSEAGKLTVSVAQTMDGQRKKLAGISLVSLLIGVSFFLLTALLATIAAKSATRPLHRLAASVSRRGPRDLRPVEAPVPSEMAPLVTSLNSFMLRLKHSLAESEEFIAEAAHRVRTPLAVVRTRAETTLRRVEKPENRETVREMIRAIDESSRSAGQLLDHAMVTFRADHLEQQQVDLPALVLDLVESLRPMSELRDVDLSAAKLEPAVVIGDGILIQNALRNVIDNAIKYSGSEGQVEVSVHTAEQTATLTVTDTGPGFPDDPDNALLKRYARGDNVAGIVGSGLGLTIVDEVVRAHDGTLNYNNKPGGGACVTLSFPCL